MFDSLLQPIEDYLSQVRLLLVVVAVLTVVQFVTVATLATIAVVQLRRIAGALERPTPRADSLGYPPSPQAGTIHYGPRT